MFAVQADVDQITEYPRLSTLMLREVVDDPHTSQLQPGSFPTRVHACIVYLKPVQTCLMLGDKIALICKHDQLCCTTH